MTADMPSQKTGIHKNALKTLGNDLSSPPINYIMVYDDDLMVTLEADTLHEAMREFSRRYIEASNDALNRKNGTDHVTQTVRVSGDNTGIYELPYSLDRTSDRSWTFKHTDMRPVWKPRTVMPEEPRCRQDPSKPHDWHHLVISELATGLTVARCVICDIIRYEQLKIDHDGDLSAHNFMAYSYNKRRDNPVSW